MPVVEVTTSLYSSIAKQSPCPHLRPKYMTMYMNMCIIMCMNIYISKANEGFLRSKGSSMSGLVNSLLDKERGATPLQVAEESFSEALDDWPKAKPSLPLPKVAKAPPVLKKPVESLKIPGVVRGVDLISEPTDTEKTSKPTQPKPITYHNKGSWGA